MNGQDELPDRALDRLLDQLPTPELPAGLAQRIVAHTSALPQHERRESVIALAPPVFRPLGQQAFGQRVAGLSAFAAAACALMLLWPLDMRAPVEPIAPSAVTTATAAQEAKPVRQQVEVARADPPVIAKRAPAPAAHKKPVGPSAAASTVDPVAAQPEPDSAILAEAAPPAPTLRLAAAAPPAEVAGPKAHVQGPPTPIDIIIANSRTAQGLGVVGGAGAVGPVGGTGGGIPRQR